MLHAGNYEAKNMELKGYTQINNTLLWALMQLPKPQQHVFTCLRIESDYKTHVSNFLSIRDIIEFTGMKRPHINTALRNLEKKAWITMIDQKGYNYQWELSIAKLTNAEVCECVQAPTKTDVQSDERFQVEEIDGKSVKVLTSGPRIYRYNNTIADFEIKALWKKEEAAWEIANGYADNLSDADKIELQSHAY